MDAEQLPALSARPDPQIWYASTTGNLGRVRKRVMSGGDPSLAFTEWPASENSTERDRMSTPEPRDDSGQENVPVPGSTLLVGIIGLSTQRYYWPDTPKGRDDALAWCGNSSNHRLFRVMLDIVDELEVVPPVPASLRVVRKGTSSTPQEYHGDDGGFYIEEALTSQGLRDIARRCEGYSQTHGNIAVLTFEPTTSDDRCLGVSYPQIAAAFNELAGLRIRKST